MLIGSTYIYPSTGLSISFSLRFLTGYLSLLDQSLYLPFYLGLSAFVVAEIVIYYSVIKFCACLCNLCYAKK